MNDIFNSSIKNEFVLAFLKQLKLISYPIENKIKSFLEANPQAVIGNELIEEIKPSTSEIITPVVETEVPFIMNEEIIPIEKAKITPIEKIEEVKILPIEKEEDKINRINTSCSSH